MNEIVLDYRRVMCYLTWRCLMEKQPEMFDFIARTETDAPRDTEAPETTKIVHRDFEVCVEKRVCVRSLRINAFHARFSTLIKGIIVGKKNFFSPYGVVCQRRRCARR